MVSEIPARIIDAPQSKCIIGSLSKNLETKTLKWMRQLTGDYYKVENSHVIAHLSDGSEPDNMA
jgi:hypothetical protein